MRETASPSEALIAVLDNYAHLLRKMNRPGTGGLMDRYRECLERRLWPKNLLAGSPCPDRGLQWFCPAGAPPVICGEAARSGAARRERAGGGAGSDSPKVEVFEILSTFRARALAFTSLLSALLFAVSCAMHRPKITDWRSGGELAGNIAWPELVRVIDPDTGDSYWSAGRLDFDLSGPARVRVGLVEGTRLEKPFYEGELEAGHHSLAVSEADLPPDGVSAGRALVLEITRGSGEQRRIERFATYPRVVTLNEPGYAPGHVRREGVDVYNGSLTLSRGDLSGEGGGTRLEIRRVYHSLSTMEGPLGPGWWLYPLGMIYEHQRSAGESRALEPAGRIYMRNQDGTAALFRHDVEQGTWVSVNGFFGELERVEGTPSGWPEYFLSAPIIAAGAQASTYRAGHYWRYRSQEGWTYDFADMASFADEDAAPFTSLQPNLVRVTAPDSQGLLIRYGRPDATASAGRLVPIEIVHSSGERFELRWKRVRSGGDGRLHWRVATIIGPDGLQAIYDYDASAADSGTPGTGQLTAVRIGQVREQLDYTRAYTDERSAHPLLGERPMVPGSTRYRLRNVRLGGQGLSFQYNDGLDRPVCAGAPHPASPLEDAIGRDFVTRTVATAENEVKVHEFTYAPTDVAEKSAPLAWPNCHAHTTWVHDSEGSKTVYRLTDHGTPSAVSDPDGVTTADWSGINGDWCGGPRPAAKLVCRERTPEGVSVSYFYNDQGKAVAKWSLELQQLWLELFDEVRDYVRNGQTNVAEGRLFLAQSDAEAIGVPEEVRYHIDLLFGWLYTEQKDFEKAGRYYAQALEKARSLRGEEHADVAYVLMNQGDYFEKSGKLEQGIDALTTVVQIYEKNEGHESEDVSVALNNLAWYYYRAERYEEALPLAEESVRVGRAVEGSLAAGISNRLHTLGEIHLNLGNEEEARRDLAEALWLGEYHNGLLDEGNLWFLDSYAKILRKHGRTNDARLVENRAEELRKYSPGHHERFAQLLQQSQFLAEHEIYAPAIGALKQAVLEIGPGPARELMVLEAMHRLARLNCRVNVQCEQAVLTVIEQRSKLFPSDWPTLASDFARLADVHLHGGDTTKARSWAEKAHRIREQHLPDLHPKVAESLVQLGEVEQAAGRPEEARALYIEALERYRTEPELTHQRMLTVLANIAEIDAAAGDYEELKGVVDGLIAQAERQEGPNSESVQGLVGYAVFLFESKGATGYALPYLSRWRELRAQEFPADHPQVALIQRQLSRLYQKLGRTEEAIGALMIAVDMLTNNPNPTFVQAAQFRADLAELLDKAGRADEAERQLGIAHGHLKAELGPGHVLTAEVRLAQARRAKMAGDFSEAIDRYTEVIGPYAEWYGASPELTGVYAEYGELLYKDGRYDRAERILGEALQTARTGGAESIDAARAAVWLARTLAAKIQYEKSKKTFQAALSLLRMSRGVEPAELEGILLDYQKVLRKLGEEAEAQKVEKALERLREKGEPGPELPIEGEGQQI